MRTTHSPKVPVGAPGFVHTPQVLAVNDAPALSLPASYSTNEDTPLALTGIAASDVDAGSSAVSLSLSVPAASGVLRATASADVAVANSGTSAITITGSIDKLNAFIAAGSVQYAPAADFNGGATLSVTVDDGGNTGSGGAKSAGGTVSITVVAQPDTPSVTNASTSEDTQSTSGLVITRNAADGAEVSHFKISGITSGTLFQNDGTTEISNGDFIASAQGAAGLKFTPSADFFGTASFNVQASTSNTDVGLGGASVTASITVAAVNDAPVLSAIESSALASDEGGAATPLTSSLTVSDGDSTSLSRATVTLNGFVAGQDELGFTAQNGLSGAFDSAGGVLTLSGSASLADYQAALRSVTFRNTSPNPDTRARSVLFQVDDGQGLNNLSNTPSRSITVSSLNNAPVNTVPGAQSTDEDTALVFSTANANRVAVDDPDAGSGSVQLTLSVTHGASGTARSRCPGPLASASLRAAAQRTLR